MHAACRVIGSHFAGTGGERPRVFRIDPAFDRVAGKPDLVLGHRQRLAIGNADLFAYQVEPRDRFGDGMFDLKPGVHFDEIELAVFPQKFDRTRAAIAHVGHGLRADHAHPVAFCRGQDGRGRFFQHFLVAPLERAIALTQVNRVAVSVSEDLELDVARVAEVLLDIDSRIAERGLRLVPGLLHQAFELILAVADLHPAPAAAAGGLDDDGIADLGGDPARFFRIADGAIAAGHQRQAELARGALGLDLVAHRADMFGLRADPGDAVRLDDFGELRILAQEAITGVNRIGMGNFGCSDDRGDVEIAVGRRRRTDADSVIGQPHVHRIGIGGGVHRDRLDPHLMRSAVDAQRDFAAIGDQNARNSHLV